MARQNRSKIFDPNEVSVMHCINRAVRRAMLCGVDKFSGKSYEHFIRPLLFVLILWLNL